MRFSVDIFEFRKLIRLRKGHCQLLMLQFFKHSPIIYRSPGFQYLSMLREVTWQKKKWNSEAPILQNKAEFLLRSNCPMVNLISVKKVI